MTISNPESSMSAVESPSHYNTGKIEVIDYIEDQSLDFHLGNVVKYISRAQHKGNKVEDLRKARWYLNRSIDYHENELSELDSEMKYPK